MKLSSFGLYEQCRMELIADLLNDEKLKINATQLDTALLGPVITTIIETAFTHQQKLINNNSNLSIKDRALETNKVAFTTMLPTLANALRIKEVKLKLHVEKFVSKAWKIYSTNVDYLMTLANISKEAQAAEIERLYGKVFIDKYPDLAKLLPYNDSQLLEAATKKVSIAIREQCPQSLRIMMLQHIDYMNEISMQTKSSNEFLDEFKLKTGITMQQYKEQVQINNLIEDSSLAMISLFKETEQPKATVEPSNPFHLSNRN